MSAETKHSTPIQSAGYSEGQLPKRELPTEKELEKEAVLRYPYNNPHEADTWSNEEIIDLERAAYLTASRKYISRVKDLEAEVERLKSEVAKRDATIKLISRA